jgi:hypothetical protein
MHHALFDRKNSSITINNANKTLTFFSVTAARARDF